MERPCLLLVLGGLREGGREGGRKGKRAGWTYLDESVESIQAL